MKMQNNKKNTTYIIAVFAMGLIVMSPTTILTSTANAQNQTSELISVKTGTNHYMTLQPPILSNTDKSAIIDAAMNVPEIKAWSNQWNYSTMDFRGEKTDTGVTWNTAVVTLRLSPTAKTPFSCDIGWFAIVDVDLATKKVLNAHHPTVESHGCHGIGSGPIIYKKNADPNPGYSIATQNDVNSSTSYYGNSAVIQPPSFNNPGIYNSMTEDVEQLVNADWSKTCSLGTGSTPDCFLQGGWLITTPASGCSSCNILADSSDIVYVDQSTTGTYNDVNTGLTYYTTPTTASINISCSTGMSNYVVIGFTYGVQTYYHQSNVLCGTKQTTDVLDNSVFFENWNPNNNWASQITSSVLGTSAKEYNSANVGSSWSTSHDVDRSCSGVNSKSAVITSGNLQSGGTAYWNTLSSQPTYC